MRGALSSENFWGGLVVAMIVATACLLVLKAAGVI